jgi:5-enolpyruvylshikimate-3-phosphate synthase
MAKSAGIVMVRAVAGLVAGRTKIDRMVAMYVSYPRFFEQMAGLGARGAH